MEMKEVDVHEDGYREYILADNIYEAAVEASHADAGKGLILLGNGTIFPDILSPLISSFYSSGNFRDLAKILTNDGRRAIIVGRNNDAHSIYILN